MNHLFATVIFGLTASLCWGSGDFSGGLASRRAYTGSVVLTNYAVGLVLLVTLALIGKEPFPDPADLLWGGLAGVAGVLGLLSFYAALARAKMGIAAPVSALLTVALPVLWSRVHRRTAYAAATGGLRARGAFDCADLTPATSQRIPTGNRVGLDGRLWLWVVLHPHQARESRQHLLASGRRALHLHLCVARADAPAAQASPAWDDSRSSRSAGVLDAIGSALFVLAAHSGRLDVAAILSSLYPAATVGLSVLVLRERVIRIQAIGILLLLLAIPVILA